MPRFLRRFRRPIDDRGAVAVEAALITPVLIILIFGAIEFTLLLRDHVAQTSMVRVGARVASAEPRVGTVAGCQSSTLLDKCFAQDAADAIQRTSSALPKNSIDYIWVYLANNKGFPSQTVSGWATDGTSNFSSCPTSTCYEYRWQDGTNGNTGRFVYQRGAWDPKSINACFGAEGMAVGVYMKVTHPAVIGLFFDQFALTDSAVMKFEPLSADAPCKP